MLRARKVPKNGRLDKEKKNKKRIRKLHLASLITQFIEI